MLTELEIWVGKDWRKRVRKNYRYISNGAGEMAFRSTMRVKEGKKMSKCGDSCWEIPGIGQLRDRAVKKGMQAVIQLHWRSRNAMAVCNMFWSVMECKKDNALSWRDTSFLLLPCDNVTTIIMCSCVVLHCSWGTSWNVSGMKAEDVM